MATVPVGSAAAASRVVLRVKTSANSSTPQYNTHFIILSFLIASLTATRYLHSGLEGNTVVVLVLLK